MSRLSGHLYRFLHAVSYDKVRQGNDEEDFQDLSNHIEDYHIRKVVVAGSPFIVVYLSNQRT